jgi:hypothetical protein
MLLLLLLLLLKPTITIISYLFIFVYYFSLLYINSFAYFLQDTWEEVDPDELSYEVNWVWILVPLVELFIYLFISLLLV